MYKCLPMCEPSTPRRNSRFDIAILESLRARRAGSLEKNLLWLSRLFRALFIAFWTLRRSESSLCAKKKEKLRGKLTFDQNAASALDRKEWVTNSFHSDKSEIGYANRRESCLFYFLSKRLICASIILHVMMHFDVQIAVTIIWMIIWWEPLMVANKLCCLLFILFTLNLIVFVPGKLSSLQKISWFWIHSEYKCTQ